MSNDLGLVVRDSKVVVSSRDVARVFEKEHRRVTQDIRDLGCSEDFRLHNFVQSSYLNDQNREMPEYLMTRDGFTLLAMGYTGEKAMFFKESYINAFRLMEEELNGVLGEKAKRQALLDLLEGSKGYASPEMIDSLIGEIAGLVTGHLVLPKRARSQQQGGEGALTERAIDIVTAFMEEASMDGLVSSAEIRKSLAEWCSSHGIVPPGRTTTGLALRQLGWAPRRGAGGRRMWAY